MALQLNVRVEQQIHVFERFATLLDFFRAQGAQGSAKQLQQYGVAVDFEKKLACLIRLCKEASITAQSARQASLEQIETFYSLAESLIKYQSWST